MIRYELLWLQLKNLAAMEVNIVRPFIVRALQCFYKHDSDDLIKQTANEADSQAVASDRLPRVSK